MSAALRSSRRSGGRPLRVYECPECRGWHLTKRRTWHDPKPKAAQKPDNPPSPGCSCGRCSWLNAEEETEDHARGKGDPRRPGLPVSPRGRYPGSARLS